MRQSIKLRLMTGSQEVTGSTPVFIRWVIKELQRFSVVAPFSFAYDLGWFTLHINLHVISGSSQTNSKWLR